MRRRGTTLRDRVGAVLRRGIDRSAHGIAALAHHVLPYARPARHGVELRTGIPYRESGRRAHLLDVYRPPGPGPHPAIFYVHGGAFSMMSKDTHRIMALAFASRGYTVFNVNYRLGPRHTYPRPLEDVASALLWAIEHGREYGADPSRLALAGESAGANLVTALTYVATHPRSEPFARAVYTHNPPIRCTLAIYGLHDLHDVRRLWRHPRKAARLPGWMKRELVSSATAYVGRPLDARAAQSPLASPLRLLDEPPPPDARPLPPFFVAAGTADPLLDDSRRLKKALEARGGSCELHIYPGEIHGFNVMMWRPAARDKWRAVDAFLRRYLARAPSTSYPEATEEQS